MDKTQTITAHVMALTLEKLRKTFSLDNPGDMKRLERWHIRLSNLPNDPEYIDKLFEPFYAHKPMPNPEDLMKEHWRIADPKMLHASDHDRNAGAKRLTNSDLDRAANSPYSKGVLALIQRRHGISVEQTDRHGNNFFTWKRHENPLNQEAFVLELRRLGKTHNVPWEGVMT